MNEWPEVVALEDLRVVSPAGDRVVQLLRGEITRVHPELFRAALAAGCSIPGGSSGIAKTDEEIIDDLVEAMIDIVTAGDATQLTAAGEPRYSYLRDRVSHFTTEQREQAWARVQAQMTGGAEE